MTVLKKMSIVFGLAIAAGPFSSLAAYAGHCTHKVIIHERDRGDNLRISVFLKTSGEELTAYTGKKDKNEAPAKIGADYNNYTEKPKSLVNADPHYVGKKLDRLKAARRVAVMDVTRGTQKGFKLYIYLHHPDGRKAICTIDADQRINKVENTVDSELSRLKCRGTTSGVNVNINSCDAVELINGGNVHVGYWADVDFAD